MLAQKLVQVLISKEKPNTVLDLDSSRTSMKNSFVLIMFQGIIFGRSKLLLGMDY